MPYHLDLEAAQAAERLHHSHQESFIDHVLPCNAGHHQAHQYQEDCAHSCRTKKPHCQGPEQGAVGRYNQSSTQEMKGRSRFDHLERQKAWTAEADAAFVRICAATEKINRQCRRRRQFHWTLSDSESEGELCKSS